MFICASQIGTLAVYILFVAQNLQAASSIYFIGLSLLIDTYSPPVFLGCGKPCPHHVELPTLHRPALATDDPGVLYQERNQKLNSLYWD